MTMQKPLTRRIKSHQVDLDDSEMDAMAIQQRNEYEQVINERDILGTQLIRRNDELAFCCMKRLDSAKYLAQGERSTRND